MTDDTRTFLPATIAYPHGKLTDTEPGAPSERLFSIAKRWHMPLQRLDGESSRAMAERLSLAIEHRIALMLLDLEEIATLDLDTEGDAS